MKNVHQAVWIIATLSLLLGLSIGQLHQQFQKIEKMEGETNTVTHVKIRPSNCWSSSSEGLRVNKVRQQMDEVRARVELEKARLEKEKKRLRLEEEKKIQEIKRDKTHVILREEL